MMVTNKALKRAHTPPSLQRYTSKHPSQNNKGEEKGALSNFKQELYITISINKYGENSIQDTTTINNSMQPTSNKPLL